MSKNSEDRKTQPAISRRRFVTNSALAGVGTAVITGAPLRRAFADTCPSELKPNTSPHAAAESIIEPELPIVDPHHHLWYIPGLLHGSLPPANSEFGRMSVGMFPAHARYLLDEFLADANTGHNLRATVFMEAGAMYRTSGPEEMKSIGEVEFANGVAAMADSSNFGTIKVAAGIVGGVDLTLGDAVRPILEAHITAGDGRYRGVRMSAAYDPDPKILGGDGTPHLLLDERFRKGFRHLHQLGLSFDSFLLGPQLPDLIDLARAFPDTPIVLNHVGEPVAVANYAGPESFTEWRNNIRTLAKSENVYVKLGGLASTPLQGFKAFLSHPRASSTQLAALWKPYIETCIEAFGPKRSMFESDFPPGSNTCTYAVLWNAFKRLAAGASPDEKLALFSRTAVKAYRLEL